MNKKLLLIILAAIVAAGCVIAVVVSANGAKDFSALFSQNEKIDGKILEESSRKGGKYLVMITPNEDGADPEAFIAENGLDRADLVYSGESTGTVIVYATPEKILELAGSSYVGSILPFANEQETPAD